MNPSRFEELVADMVPALKVHTLVCTATLALASTAAVTVGVSPELIAFLHAQTVGSLHILMVCTNLVISLYLYIFMR